MALTKEDLQAIRGIVDEGVDRLEKRIDVLEADVKELKTDVNGLKADVSGIKTDVKELKDRVTNIEVVQLEQYLIPKVEEIAAYQKSVYERYTKDADRFEQKIALIDSIEQTVKEHSRQIQELQAKMA